jgi:anti-sigma28 factor (negative regulator of flagellin synthesis)
MQIHSLAHLHGSQAINAPHRAHGAQPAAPNHHLGEVDQLDISHEANMLSRAMEAPGFRADRVAEIRAAIQSGVYETDDKLDIAMDRLLRQISG